MVGIEPSRQVLIQLVVGCALSLFGEIGFAQRASPLLPIPSDAAREQATRTIGEVYQSEYEQANSRTEKAALAQKMLADARETKADATARYVLLRVSKDIADEIGHLETAYEAIAEMSRQYQVDPLMLKAEAVIDASHAASKPEHFRALAGEFISLLEQAVGADRYEIVEQLRKPALESARKARNKAHKDLIEEAVDRGMALGRAFQTAQDSMARLEQSPTDSAANLAVGRYYCFAKHDWPKGLPMLALGNDAQLQELGIRELKGVDTSQKQYELAEAWSEAAQQAEASPRAALLQRAAHWYRTALPELTALQRAATENFLKDHPSESGFEPLNWAFQRVSWRRGTAPISLMPQQAGLCYLSAAAGNFAGSGELVQVGIDNNQRWLFSGKSKQDSLVVEAYAVGLPELKEMSPSFQQVHWKVRQEPIRLLHKSQGICLLSRVGGYFGGAAEYVRLHIADDGYWYLSGSTGKHANNSLASSAIAVIIPKFESSQTSFEEFYWLKGQPRQKLIHRSQGFCMLSGMGGRFAGGGERVEVYIDESDGYWYLGGHAAPPGTHGRAIAVKFGS